MAGTKVTLASSRPGTSITITCGHPVDAIESVSEGLWAKAVLSAKDAVIVVVVNEQYTATGAGFTQKPVPSAQVTVSVPPWLMVKQVSAVSPEGLAPIPFDKQDGTLKIRLADIREGKLLILR